jgi:predicted ArsR family transcriptional regulator
VEPFPEDVTRFLETNIGSVDELEVLRVLSGDRGVEFDATVLAKGVQVPAEAISAHLDALERRGLLTVIRGPGVAYRHGAHTPELEAALGRLLQMYNERPVTMIRMVYARANSALKTFADAFRLRKEG